MFHKRKIFLVGGARLQSHDRRASFAGLFVDDILPKIQYPSICYDWNEKWEDSGSFNISVEHGRLRKFPLG